jgi:hypothetical protein
MKPTKDTVYRWLKGKNGMVTIEEMLDEFTDADPEVLAEGFNMYLDSQDGHFK